MADGAAPDILELEPKLVSPVSGIVRRFDRVYKDVTEPVLPYVWRAELANHQFAGKLAEDSNTASGKGLDHASARRGALGEAVERYCALRAPPAGITVARRADLPGESLDPRALVLYAEEQYPELSYQPWSEDLTLAWVEGRTLTAERPVWLPAQAVYLSHADGSPPLAQGTSNGLAAGPTLAAAKLRALCEVIERDAFMIAWYAKLPVRRLDWRHLPDRGVVGVAQAFARRGVAVELFLLPSDHAIPVVAGIGFEEGGDALAAVVGLGCDPSLAKAAAGAVMEVGQVRSPLRMRMRRSGTLERRDELVADPSRVAELEDHDLLYTDARMAHAFAAWRSAPLLETDWEELAPASPEEKLEFVDAELARIGAEAWWAEVTTPDIAGLGLHVVRAIIEDFQPIHFGEKEIRLGGRRLYTLAQRAGFATAPLTRADLNPLPHPLS